jgi:hypothetical protein
MRRVLRGVSLRPGPKKHRLSEGNFSCFEQERYRSVVLLVVAQEEVRIVDKVLGLVAEVDKVEVDKAEVLAEEEEVGAKEVVWN